MDPNYSVRNGERDVFRRLAQLSHNEVSDLHSDTHARSGGICSAYDSGSRTSTPFSSATDALIARLRLESGLGVPTINLFFDILHHPLFKLEDVTLADAFEVDLEVAKCRIHVQEARGCTLAAPSSSGTGNGNRLGEVPYPILESILDAIATDKELVDDPLQPQIPLVNTLERKREDSLRTMALVHRTWTIPSQRRLAARIVARSPSAILRLLRSPLPGRHTRELIVSLSLGEIWNRRYRPIGMDAPAWPSDVETDLCNLFRRLPQLKHLTLKESGLREDMLLPVISGIETLESLSWHCAHGYPSCDFTYLADALRWLLNITSLEVSGWSFHAASSTLASVPFRRHLTDISISPGDMQFNRVGWPLQALVIDGRKTKLTLDITLIGTLRVSEVFRLYPGAKEALAHLDTLHLINKAGFEEFNLAQARTLLKACKAVKHLHIQGQFAPITEFIDILPTPTEELCFSWFDMWMSPWNLVERHLLDLLKNGRMECLKRIVIYNYEVPFYRAPVEDNGEPVSHPCPDAQEACNQAGIELDLWSKPPDWRSI